MSASRRDAAGDVWPRALTVFPEVMVETPVWGRPYGTGAPWTVSGLVDRGVPAGLVRRLAAWNDHVWEGIGRVDGPPDRQEPGWWREGDRLVRELHGALPDVDVIVGSGPDARPFREHGLPEGDRPVDADRPIAVTVMAAPTTRDPLFATPFGRCTVVDPEALFVTPGLVARLRAWNAAYPGPQRLDEPWCATGLALARELQDELWDVAVHYFEDDDPRPVRERRR